MTIRSPAPTRRAIAAAAFALTLLGAALPAAHAGPGAHGPDGEHLDAPATSGSAAPARPRVEASTELFELVATLQETELSILIDRYESNEPVLGASLEIESAGLKAQATFQADHGHYAVDDPALLARLRTPGEHGLVFTLVAGDDADLLDGTLVVAAPAGLPAGEHGHHHDAHAHDAHTHDDHGHMLEQAAWIGGTALVAGALGALGGVAWTRSRRRGAALRGAQ